MAAKGYGHSLWAVPLNYKSIKAKYHMKHIPHVPLKTRLEEPSHSVDLFNHVKLEFYTQFVWKPDVYRGRSSGFDCKISGLHEPIEHYPHMTIWYDYYGNHANFVAPEDCMAKVVRVNTTSENPEEWFIGT